MRILILLVLFFFIFVGKVIAIENPTLVPNNIYGIHIVDENDIDMASDLVNSAGGDWGYVTMVIREDERSTTRWQKIFDKLRRKHLIPIIRIATKQESEGWVKPDQNSIDSWIAFFESLNWVIKNRYIVVGNEPNQAHEWSGEIKPEEYGQYLKAFSSRLKNTSSDYFVLPAGLDSAAPESKSTMSEKKFLETMLKSVPDAFDKIDGWTSHAYPNYKLSIEEQRGQASLRNYLWEKDLLSSLGFTRNLPVFITETGWKHDGNGNLKDINSFYKNAFESIWVDNNIIAITPFLLNYKASPYLSFSWIDADNKPFDFYYTVQNLSKIKGEPMQKTDGEIIGSLNFPIVQAGHGVYGALIAKNLGQSIWEKDKFYLLGANLLTNVTTEPFQTRFMFFKLQAPNDPGTYKRSLQLVRNGARFGNLINFYFQAVDFLPNLNLFGIF